MSDYDVVGIEFEDPFATRRQWLREKGWTETVTATGNRVYIDPTGELPSPVALVKALRYQVRRDDSGYPGLRASMPVPAGK